MVIVSDKVPLFQSQVLTGKTGTTALAATSVARNGAAHPYCILALGSVATDIRSNGAPDANLNGCNVMSNTGATCNGSNLNANIGEAHGTNSRCGVVQKSNAPVVNDPYKSLASNIPADNCGGSYPQETGKNNSVPNANQWGSGSYTLSGNKIVCGDQKLTANTYISAPSNAVLVIENGILDTNGFLFQTTAGSGLTIVFTGAASNGNYQHYPIGSGTLDIARPPPAPGRAWRSTRTQIWSTLEAISTFPTRATIRPGTSPAWSICQIPASLSAARSTRQATDCRVLA